MASFPRSLGRHTVRMLLLSVAPFAAFGCVVYGDDLLGEASNGVSSNNGGSLSGDPEGGSGSGGNGSSLPPILGSSGTGGSSATGSTSGGDTSSPGGSGSGSTTGNPTAGTGATPTGNTAGTTNGGSDPGGQAGAPVDVGGSTGVAGSGGMGGSDPDPGGGGTGGTVVVVPIPDNVVDNMEDNNNRIHRAESRDGFWFTFNDESAEGTQVPEAGEDFEMVDGCDRSLPESARCARSLVTGDFSVYGAGFGFDLRASKVAYDVSKYTKIRFWAKNDDTSTGDVTLAIATTSSEGATSGPPAFEMLLPLDGDWTEYTVAFSQLMLSDWYSEDDRDSIVWDPKEVLKVQFKTGASVTHDIYVDDITFVE